MQTKIKNITRSNENHSFLIAVPQRFIITKLTSDHIFTHTFFVLLVFSKLDVFCIQQLVINCTPYGGGGSGKILDTECLLHKVS